MLKYIQHTNSKPITPAPMTISLFGTSFNESAPVDDTICSSSICSFNNKIKLQEILVSIPEFLGME